MHTYEDAKKMLHKELANIVNKGELSAGSLETIDKLLNAIKNAYKIEMYEEYTEGEYSQADGYSLANQKRDSRGRYSRDDGYSMANRRRDSMGRYSRDSKMMVEELKELMHDAPDERTKMEFKKFIQKMEQMG